MKVDLIKAYCKKTGKKFCIEIDKEKKKGKAINFIELSDEEYKLITSTTNLATIETASTLLPCSCGKRIVAGCNCPSKQKKCKLNSAYNFQCIYCDQLTIETPKGKDLKIYVTSPQYDNISEVLDKMNIKYKQFNGKYDCDILFINCGTYDVINDELLKNFVFNGGQLYLSDLASKYISSCFSSYAKFRNDTKPCELTATVVDKDLQQYVGNTIKVELDLGAWSLITETSAKVLLRSQQSFTNPLYGNKPIMIMFNYGQGKVFYTSFHNHKQASENEKILLQVLVLKQMAEKAEMSMEDMNKLLGLNLKLK